MIDSLPAQTLMDRDESNLRSTAVDGVARAEIYRFASPSVTAGRNAKVLDEDLARWAARNHAFARRPTGGGILRHDGDISFGFTFPVDAVNDRDSDPSAGRFLRLVSGAIAAALRLQRIETHTAAGHDSSAPALCFHRAVGCELLFDGRKLLGLAARRIRGGVLIQGSLTVSRNEALDRDVIGAGPVVDLMNVPFDPEQFALSLRALLQNNG